MNETSKKSDNLSLRAVSSIARAFRERGLESFGFLGEEALRGATEGVAPVAATAYGLSAARGAVVTALPYDTTGLPAGSLDPRASRDAEGRLLGDLGWFARSDWYRKLVGILGGAVEETRPIGDWTRGDFRVAVNSRLPEKPLAVAAGLGPLGRNTLVLNPLLGPGCVLGFLLLPFDPGAGHDGAPQPVSPRASGIVGSECRSCDACVRACPTQALLPSLGIRRERCIQYWASTRAPVPSGVAELWRGNLYGCDLCLAACPRFRMGVELPTAQGRLGAGLSLGHILAAEEGELRRELKKTALGLGWITPALLKRNALLAAASRLRSEGRPASDEPEIRDAALRYSLSEDAALSAAARVFLDL